jgi:hypothetical protein
MKDTSLEGFDSNLMQILPIWISPDNESIKVPNKIEGNLKEGEITFGGNLITNKKMTVGTELEVTKNINLNGDSLKIKGITNSTPVGAIISYLGEKDEDPDGWVICNGKPRTYDVKYESLLGLGIGTRSGGGYIPPNLNNRFLKQTTVKEMNQENDTKFVLTVNQLPKHTHTGRTREMNQNASHSHGVYDPGHTHMWDRGLEQDDNGYGNSSNEFTDRGGEVNSIRSARTGIGIYNQNTDHNHPFTTDITGNGDTIKAPDPLFYGVKFIVKY